MAFESITKGKWKVGRPRGSGHPSELTICGKPGCKAGSGRVVYRNRLLFRIAMELWQKAEMEPGQKVEVLFDKEKMLGLIRVVDHGYQLSVTHPSPDGTFGIKFLIPHNEETGFPYYAEQTGMLDVEVNNGEIQFRLAPQGDPAFKSLGTNHQGNGEYHAKIRGKKKEQVS